MADWIKRAFRSHTAHNLFLTLIAVGGLLTAWCLDVDRMALLTMGMKLVAALFVLELVALTLRRYDLRSQIDFIKDVLPALKTDAKALALYFSVRFGAICYVIAAAVGAFLLVAVLSSQGWAATLIPSTYDKSIQSAASKWLPGVSWKLLKGQYWQESRLDPTARSPAGAEGIAQFMGPSFGDVMKQMGYRITDRRLAEPSIEGGAYYMARLRREWSAPRPERDRHSLALASYNAGLGSILGAQRACGGAALYEEVMRCLPGVTGANARETAGYAPAIYRWYAMLSAGA